MEVEETDRVSESSESSEESENNILLDSEDSLSVSISSTDEDGSSDISLHKPASDPAVVFSATIENSDQATEILIEAEPYWHDGDGEEQEEALRTSLNIRVKTNIFTTNPITTLSYCRKIF